MSNTKSERKTQRKKPRKCWLLTVRAPSGLDLRTAHLLHRLGFRLSHFQNHTFVSAYASECKPLLDRHVARLAAVGIEAKARRVNDWLPARKPGTVVDQALTRYERNIRAGKALPYREPRPAVSPAEFARIWLSARKAAATAHGNGQPQDQDTRRIRKKAVPLDPAPGWEQSTCSELPHRKNPVPRRHFTLSDGSARALEVGR